MVRVGTALEPGSELFDVVAVGRYVKVSTEASDADRVVVVAGLSAELTAGEQTLDDPEFVDGVAAAAGEGTSMPGTIALATPSMVGTVPSSAVVTDTTRTICFFPDVDGAGIAIDATEGSFGLVDVDPSLVGEAVLLNPRDVRVDLSCG